MDDLKHHDTCRLTIFLPKDRTKMGWFNLLTGDDHLLMTGPARGKADNQRAIKEGNPMRLPIKPYGDTPSGTFHETSPVTFAKPHGRLGVGWIPLRGKSGDALVAESIGGREGLGLHAGRGDDHLMATYGCIRVTDSDYDRLDQLIRANGGHVAVTVHDVEVTS
ncbi:MAG: hypothetical protein ABF335_13285 [Alphaproteobacteria bacterium]